MIVMKPSKGRERLSLGALKAVRKAVRAEADRFNVSMSFVQNVALAWALGVKIEEDYHKVKDSKVLRIKRRA